jgi:hypothetical protein
MRILMPVEFHSDPAVDDMVQDYVFAGLLPSPASPFWNPTFAALERTTVAELKLAVFKRFGRAAADTIAITVH